MTTGLPTPLTSPARDRSAVAAPVVSVVVVNWNTAELVQAALESVRDHTPAGLAVEVIVVDNASTDGSADKLRAEWPELRLLVNESNLGYTAASNRAFDICRGEFVLRLDSDARLTPGCLETLLARARRDDRVGAVGPRLVYGDGSWQRWTAGRVPDLSATAVWLTAADRIAPRAGVYLGRDSREAFQPEWVCGACCLIRRSALTDIGGLDEQRITAYMDDVDLCRRLRDKGWVVWYEPTATAVHLMSQSTRKTSGPARTAPLRDFNRYVLENRGPGYAAALAAIEIGGFGSRALALALVGGVRPAARGRAREHWTHVKTSLEIFRKESA